jgi:predicted nucleic acid-binding Zn ribbon protein
MERAARLIKNSKLSRQLLGDEDLARAAWPSVVGRAIAAHTSRITLVRSTLVVEVEDAIWQQQLYRLTPQILDRLHKLTGNNGVGDIEFRIAVPRLQPQRAERPESARRLLKVTNGR